MKQQILQFIQKRHVEKIETKRVTHYITFREINEHFGGVDRMHLRELVKEKQVEHGRTINDFWFAPIFNQ